MSLQSLQKKKLKNVFFDALNVLKCILQWAKKHVGLEILMEQWGSLWIKRKKNQAIAVCLFPQYSFCQQPWE